MILFTHLPLKMKILTDETTRRPRQGQIRLPGEIISLVLYCDEKNVK